MSKNTKVQGTIRDQLKTHGVLLTKTHGLPSHPSQWKGDGVDHINVAMNGSTDLGKLLNGRSGPMFQHPILGQFRTIENLSQFIRSESHADSIRMMENFTKIRDLIYRSGGLRKVTPNYRAVMVHSVYLKILHDFKLLKLMLESELPFDSYSINNQTMLRQRFEPAAFLCAGYTEIRAALKERRSPELHRFLDNGISRDADIYEGIMNQLTGGTYQNTAAEIIAQYEEKRWAAYDAWCEKQSARAAQAAEAKLKKEKAVQSPAPTSVVVLEASYVKSDTPVASYTMAASDGAGGASCQDGYMPASVDVAEVANTPSLEIAAVEVEEPQPVLEEVGGISVNVIESTEEPSSDYPEGTRWFNPERTTTYIMVHLSTGNVWMHYDYLMDNAAFDVPNGRCVTFIKPPFPIHVDPMIMECWELGLFVQNPITHEILYPFIETVDSPVALVSQKPERFEQAEADGRVVADAKTVAELANVPEAAIASVNEAEVQAVTGSDPATVAMLVQEPIAATEVHAPGIVTYATQDSSVAEVNAANSGLSEMQSSM